MTTKRKSYKGLVIVLTFILIALFIYVNRDQKDDNTELLKEKEFQNRKLLDSLNKVGGELVRVIEEQKRREAESFDKFKRETERLKKNTMKNFAILAILLMTSTCGFCQKNYPRKIEVGGDTCVIITMPQVKVINHRLLHRRFLMEENDTLRVRYLDLTKFIQIKNIQIDGLLKLNVDYRFRLENEMAVNLEYQKTKPR